MTQIVSSRTGRPLRITYLITDLNVGGVPLHLHRLLQRLPMDRVRARVISLADEGPVGSMLRRDGIPVQACGARGVGDVRALWRLWRMLRADPPDILHALLFHANIAARVAGPLAGLRPARIVCEIQTVECQARWHLWVDNLTCRLCRCEVGNSPSVVDHLHQAAHIPITRLRCEMGAVEVERITRAEPVDRQSLGLPAGEPMILWTGRLDPVKGFEEMLAAFARVSSRPPARLVLAGEGNYRTQIEKLVRQHGLSDRVLLLGQRSDVPGLLRAADLFLFCSRTEGLPNAVLEAMAAGLPVVATDVPGCRDLITSGINGLLVRAGCAEAIAGGIEDLLRDVDRARELGRRAQAWVVRHADAGQLGQRWVRFYAGLLP